MTEEPFPSPLSPDTDNLFFFPQAAEQDRPLRVRLSEVIGAVSYALDMTEGQPPGHCLRSCLIGMRIAHPFHPWYRGAFGPLLHASSQGRRLQQQCRPPLGALWKR